MFGESASTDSCTMGVWAAYDKATSTVVLDTEGMMGVSQNVNKRVRMLLKASACSGVRLQCFLMKSNGLS